MSVAPDPFHVFNFEVVFKEVTLSNESEAGTELELCSAAFSEVTGMEATMEPKVIKEGGRNYGVVQRVGPVTFATVILKRGITAQTELWRWFDLVAGGHSAKRLNAYVHMRNAVGADLLVWKLHRALPIKFKTPDLNATATNVGIEELHLAHEGLELARSAPPVVATGGARL